MDARTEYFKNVPEVLERGLQVNNKTKKDLEEYIQIIKDWLKTQPHLPETPNDHLITMFLMMSKFTIEKSKRSIDMYYTLRTVIPELFKNCHPLLPHMQYVMDRVYWIPLPNLTQEGYRVSVAHYASESDSEPFSLQNNIAHMYNICEIRMNEDYMVGDVYIFDLGNFKVAHLMQMTPSLLKKAATVIEEVFTNIVRQIHFINYPSYADPLIAMAKKIISPKLAQRFIFHKGVDTISDYLPINILPKDYGGDELSLYELNEIWKQKCADYKERFDLLEKMEVNEKLRPTPLTNDEVLGFYGNFKKLNVD